MRGTGADIREYESNDGHVVLPRRAPSDREPLAEANDGIGARIDPVIRRGGRWLLDRFPNSERPLQVCRGLYADLYVRLVGWRYDRAHRTTIDPFRVFTVDPDRITHVSEPTGLSRFRRAGTVVDGDWDRRCVAFTETDVYRAFEARFTKGTSWSETAFFDRVVSEIEDGAEPWGCRTRDEFERRCDRLDRLAESVRTDGFLTQQELADSDVADPFDRFRGTLRSRVINDEVAVDIGRDGELLYADGRNRLSLAKVLGVESLPVIVLRRHSQWVAYRDAVAEYVERTGEIPAAARDHPDLEPIVN